MECIEKFEQDGKLLEIFLDEDPESPRDWDNLGTMAVSHRRYNLGDEKYNEERVKNAYHKMYLEVYEHSGISMHVLGEFPYDRQWDVTPVGCIYVDRKKAEAHLGKNPDRGKIEAIFREELSIYNAYLNGCVYGYRVTKINDSVCGGCDRKLDDEEDSCWGFYTLDGIMDYSGFDRIESAHVPDTLRSWTPPR